MSLFRQAQQPSERSEESRRIEILRCAQNDISGQAPYVFYLLNMSCRVGSLLPAVLRTDFNPQNQTWQSTADSVSAFNFQLFWI